MLITTPDARRLIRPLFLTPDGKTALPSKKYYDIFTFFLTQAAFAYTVAPFVILGFSDSIKVWSRVYFYTLFGTAASFALFSRSLPFRAYLIGLQNARTGTAASTAKTNDEANTSLNSGKVDKVARDEAQASLRQEQDVKGDIDSERRAGGDDPDSALLGSGLSADLEKDVEEIVAEVRREVEERKRRGSLVQGFDVRKAVDEKIRQVRGR
jgi:lysophospholipid acyltransferase